jgi:hypothetical protein
MKDRLLCLTFTALIYLAMGLLLAWEPFRLALENEES